MTRILSPAVSFWPRRRRPRGHACRRLRRLPTRRNRIGSCLPPRASLIARRGCSAGGHSMAREFSAADISPVFKVNGDSEPESEEYEDAGRKNFADWRLRVDGLVAKPLDLSLGDLRNCRSARRSRAMIASKAGALSANGRAFRSLSCCNAPGYCPQRVSPSSTAPMVRTRSLTAPENTMKAST